MRRRVASAACLLADHVARRLTRAGVPLALVGGTGAVLALHPFFRSSGPEADRTLFLDLAGGAAVVLTLGAALLLSARLTAPRDGLIAASHLALWPGPAATWLGGGIALSLVLVASAAAVGLLALGQYAVRFGAADAGDAARAVRVEVPLLRPSPGRVLLTGDAPSATFRFATTPEDLADGVLRLDLRAGLLWTPGTTLPRRVPVEVVLLDGAGREAARARPSLSGERIRSVLLVPSGTMGPPPHAVRVTRVHPGFDLRLGPGDVRLHGKRGAFIGGALRGHLALGLRAATVAALGLLASAFLSESLAFLLALLCVILADSRELLLESGWFGGSTAPGVALRAILALLPPSPGRSPFADVGSGRTPPNTELWAEALRWLATLCAGGLVVYLGRRRSDVP